MDSTQSDISNQSGLTGWIKLHRQIVDSAVFQDSELLRLWIWLLSKARHAPGHYRIESGKASAIVTLEIGDVIVGRNKTSEELGWKPDTYRDRLSRLEKMGMVTRRSTNLCTVVSITNFQHFQRGHDDRDTNHQETRTPTISEIGHQPSTEGKPSKNIDGTDALRLADTNHSLVSTPTGHQPDTNRTPLKKNVKNVKNEKKNTGACRPTLNEVIDYSKSRPSSVDPIKFHDFYEANGWIQGKGKQIKDWQAAYRTWERSDFKSRPVDNAQPSTPMTKITGPVEVPPAEPLKVRQYPTSKV